LRTRLETEVELLKLARVLRVEAEEVGFLAEQAPAEIRELRNAVLDHLLARDRAQFDRVVALAGHLPVGLAAMLAEHAVGPQLAGRLAGLLEVEQIAEFAERLPAEFLAEIAPVVDLRSFGPLISDISEEKLLAAARVLIAREDWITIAAFVDNTPLERLGRTINLIDGEAVLRVGIVIEQRARIDEILALVDEETLRELLVAATEPELARAALHLISAVGDRGVERIGRVLAELGEDEQAALAHHFLTDAEFRQAAERLIERAPAPVHAAIRRAEAELSDA
jgi:hypothetical protein